MKEPCILGPFLGFTTLFEQRSYLETLDLFRYQTYFTFTVCSLLNVSDSLSPFLTSEI